jgi:pimeloyl-ACP methyl ester carboxylesterase
VSARVIAIVSLVALTTAGCGSRGTDGTSEPARATPEPKQVVGLAGSIVDVGGHYLYFECVGNGSPTVVLEAGFGGDVKSWRWVQPQLGRTTRTCSYNRAGINGSSEIPGVHDANDEIRDLERLLDRAKIRPPYVLVGHSYGGLLVRLFAGRHPDDVAGIVLLDSAHPDYATRMEAALPPRPALTELRRQLVTPKVVDGVALRKGAALARGVRSLGDTPLVVLTAGEDQPGNPFPPAIVRRLHAVWLQLQDETAALSSEHVHAVALLSDHFIQAIGGQPDVVVRAVRSVVRARRADVPLPSCARMFRGTHVQCRG